MCYKLSNMCYKVCNKNYLADNENYLADSENYLADNENYLADSENYLRDNWAEMSVPRDYDVHFYAPPMTTEPVTGVGLQRQTIHH